MEKLSELEHQYHQWNGDCMMTLFGYKFHPSWILGLRWRFGNFLRKARYHVREIRGRLPLEHDKWRWFVGVFVLLRRMDMDRYVDCTFFENKNVRGRSQAACNGFGSKACKFCRHYKTPN